MARDLVDNGDVFAPVRRFGTGAGPESVPVAFIHGFLGSPDMWRSPGVGSLGGAAGALLLPLPGHHPWSVPPDGIGALLDGDRFVDVLAGTLARETGGRPAALVGHSTGALVALMIAERAPELVDSVMVVGGLGAGSLDGRRSVAASVCALPWLGRHVFRRAMRYWISTPARFREALKSVGGPRSTRPSMPDRVRVDLASSDPDAIRAMGLWIQRTDIMERLKRIDRPVRIVVCRADPVVPPAHQLELLRRLPRADAVMLDTGHLPMTEDVAGFSLVLAHWLRSRGGLGPARAAMGPVDASHTDQREDRPAGSRGRRIAAGALARAVRAPRRRG